MSEEEPAVDGEKKRIVEWLQETAIDDESSLSLRVVFMTLCDCKINEIKSVATKFVKKEKKN